MDNRIVSVWDRRAASATNLMADESDPDEQLEYIFKSYVCKSVSESTNHLAKDVTAPASTILVASRMQGKSNKLGWNALSEVDSSREGKRGSFIMKFIIDTYCPNDPSIKLDFSFDDDWTSNS